MSRDTTISIGPMYVQIEGVDRLLHIFDVLPDHLNQKVKRQAVKAAGDIMADKMRELCRFGKYSKGWFKKSIGVRVRTYGDYTVAIIGPRMGRRGTRENIAHLIEHGWRLGKHGTGTLARETGKSAATSRVTGKAGEGEVVGRVEGKHIMRRAYRATLRQVQNTLLQRLRQGVIDTSRALSQGAV